MRGDKIKTNILSVQIIPNADAALLQTLGAPEGIHSLGIITTDCDDVSYAALDEATKKAECTVVYARSMYAGSGNASTAYAGEFIGILGSPDPAEVKSGVSAAVSYIENDAAFISARNPDIAFLPTRLSAAAAFSDSDKPEKAVLQSARISDRSLMEPSALVVATVTSPMEEPQIFTSPERLFMIVLREVPA